MEKSKIVRCIAIDDEPFALKIIEDYCCQIPWLHLLESFNNPVEAYSYIQQHQVDIVFLDIQMPDINGLQMAEQLNKIPFVVFTTAYSHYAVESYDLGVVDYLLKPYDFERFYKAVDKVKNLILLQSYQKSVKSKLEEYIQIKAEYKKINIRLGDILFLESMDNYVKIRTIDKQYITLQSLKSMNELLPEEDFIRIHKSYIIAKSKMDYYNNKMVCIKAKQIPIGRTYQHQFLSVMEG